MWGSAATAYADDALCTGQQGPITAAPEFYQDQYNASIAKPLTKDLKTYHAAVDSGDPKQIG